jgi:uncharacterized protein (TIGR04255 family)
MSDHKVYAHPPIAMVAVEVRHSGTDPVSEAGYSAIRERLRKRWPVQVPAQDITLEFGSSGPSPTVVDYRRFISRDRRTAIVIRPNSTTVETVDYKGWDDMQSTLEVAFEVRADVSEPSGFERVGLRYIDEVRVPYEEGGPIDWSPWVHESLLGARPDDTGDLVLSEWQGLSKFGPKEGRSVVVRYGPREGYAVEPNGPLRRPNTPNGPFFLLDFDSFWETSDSVPEFEPLALMSKCDDLHAPVRKLFEDLITVRLREEVLDAEL